MAILVTSHTAWSATSTGTVSCAAVAAASFFISHAASHKERKDLPTAITRFITTFFFAMENIKAFFHILPMHYFFNGSLLLFQSANEAQKGPMVVIKMKMFVFFFFV
jgi:hypothetical protein